MTSNKDYADLLLRARKLISAAAAWPPNRNHLYYCMYIWLRLPESLNKLTVENNNSQQLLSQLTELIPQEVQSLLASISDIYLADQRNDVPIGWYGKPYRFFFGDVERPLAFMKKFLEDFMPIGDIFREKSVVSPSALLNFSLVQQDILINKIDEITCEVDANQNESLQVPPLDFQEKWWQCLEESWDISYNRLSENEKQEIKSWIEKQVEKSESIKQVPIDHGILINLFVVFENGNKRIIPFPQMWLNHLVGFCTQEARKLLADPRINQIFVSTTKHRVIEYLALLSQQTSDAMLFSDVHLKLGVETSCEVDALLLVDVNKLIVVTSAVGIIPEEFESSIDSAINNLSNVCNLINKASNSQQLVVESSYNQNSLGLDPSVKFIAYPLIITNKVTLDPVYLGIDSAPEDTQFLMLTDLEAITSEIEDALDFIRFINAIAKLRESKIDLIYTDFLDVWEMYRSNGYNFLWSAEKHPNVMFILPHGYSEKEIKALAEKADTRRLMIEERISERCKCLDIEDDTLRLMDPISLDGIAIKTSTMQPRKLIIHICSRESHGNDVRSNGSLTESILRRYEEIRDIAEGLIKIAPPDYQNRLVIWLYGEQTLRSARTLHSLENHLDKYPQECVISRGTALSSKGIGVALPYRHSLLERMGQGTIEGELLLVKAILQGIASAVKAPQGILDPIMNKVCISEKKGINVDIRDTIHTWNDARKPHQRNPVIKAQTTVQTAQMLSSLGIKPAEYRGQKARDLINLQVFPFLRELLDDNLRELDISDVVRWVYLQVENSSAYYQIERLKLESASTSLDIEYDFGKAAYDVQSANVQIIEAGSLILERAALIQRSGAKRMNREIGEKLLDYAISLLEYSQSSEQDYYKIEEIAFEIRDDYAFSLDVAKDSALDMISWQEDFAVDDHIGNRPSKFDASVEGRKRRRYPDDHPELKEIADEFLKQFGHSLGCFLQVMMALSAYPVSQTDKHYPLAIANFETLVTYLSSRMIDYQADEAEKALGKLCLIGELIKENWRPWRLKSRTHRFTMHPLFPLGDEYIFGPWFVERTGKIWLAYIYEGLLPIPESGLSEGLRGALQNYRNQKNKQLEDEVAAEIDKLELHNIGPRIQDPEKLWGANEGVPVGEIDIIAASISNKVLYVLEVKDPARTLLIDNIKNQIDDYYEGDLCFQSRLMHKTSYITSRLSNVLSDMGINQSDQWQVKPVFVTRFPVSAAYHEKRKCPFVTLKNIEVLKSSDRL